VHSPWAAHVGQSVSESRHVDGAATGVFPVQVLQLLGQALCMYAALTPPQAPAAAQVLHCAFESTHVWRRPTAAAVGKFVGTLAGLLPEVHSLQLLAHVLFMYAAAEPVHSPN
jgi:hypothetical protein